MNENKYKFEIINKLDLFFCMFLSFEFFLQSIREILLDRNIIFELLPLISMLFLGIIFSLIWCKFFKKEFLIIIFGISMSFGNIILRIPDIGDIFYTYYTGMYFIFFSISPIFIGVFGYINENNKFGKKNNKDNKENIINILNNLIDAKFLAIFSIILAVSYNLLFRLLEISNDLLLNIFLSFIVFGFCIKMFINIINELKMLNTNFKIKRNYNKESLENLKKYEHAGKNSLFLLCNIPAFIWLTLPFSYPEVYAYLTGLNFGFTITLIIIGLFVGAIFGSIAFRENNNLIKKITPILSILSLLFGFAPFFGSKTPILIPIFLVAGYIVGFTIHYIFESFFEQQNYDFEKILGVFLFLMYFCLIGIKLITIERYMPYLEGLLALGFIIPAFSFYFKKIKEDEINIEF